MDMLSFFASGTRVIGWALVHFIWQGLLIGLAYAAVKAVLPRGEARYRLGMFALIALAMCPLVTVWHLLQTSTPTFTEAIGIAPTIAMTSTASSGFDDGASYTPLMLDAIVNALLPWLVLAWLCGVSGLSFRAWRQWRKIRVQIHNASETASWQARVDAMAKRFGLRRRISVLCSSMISTPVLVGWIKPVILLPIAVACAFPVAQVELILAHELAHLRRFDPLANLFQVVLETLHFYHPVVRWISRDVRNEREICCDRMALNMCGGSRHDFASALAELGELREQHSALSLAANGGVLLDRVQQLMLPRAENSGVANPARFAAALLAVVLILVTIRLEWSEAKLEQNLTMSLSQWNASLSAAPLALASSGGALHLRDLVPLRLYALHPASKTRPPAAAGLTESAVLLPVAVQVLANITLPQLSPVRVGAFTQVRAETPLRLAQTMAPDIAEAPTPIHIRRPTYPQVALLQGVEGKVIVEFDITADGSVHDLRVVSAVPSGIFEQAALEAMHGWKYASGGAQPLGRYRKTLEFTLDGSRAARSLSSAAGNQAIAGRVGCQISIGSNICRSPENAPSQAR